MIGNKKKPCLHSFYIREKKMTWGWVFLFFSGEPVWAFCNRWKILQHATEFQRTVIILDILCNYKVAVQPFNLYHAWAFSSLVSQNSIKLHLEVENIKLCRDGISAWESANHHLLQHLYFMMKDLDCPLNYFLFWTIAFERLLLYILIIMDIDCPKLH